MLWRVIEVVTDLMGTIILKSVEILGQVRVEVLSRA
jgi:hypothetical protein